LSTYDFSTLYTSLPYNVLPHNVIRTRSPVPFTFCKTKSEICISGMTTSSRHTLPKQPKSREEKRAWLYHNQFQKWRHKQSTNVRNRRVTDLGLSVAKQLATGGLNQVLGCPNRFSYQQTSTSCLSEKTLTHPSAQQMLNAKAHKHIKHKKLIALQSESAGTQWSYRDHSTWSQVSKNMMTGIKETNRASRFVFKDSP
jgi:hypothetical protein